jgi:hypothetical protein
MTRLLCFALLFFSILDCAAGATFLVTNDISTDSARTYANLWFWPEHDNAWKRPPTRLTPKRPTEQVTLQPNENHYLVVIDAFNNKDHLGWYNFDDLLGRFPQTGELPTIILSSLYMMQTRTRTLQVKKYKEETRTYEYKVTKMVPEQRVRTVTYWDRCLQAWVSYDVTYTVVKPVWETRTGEYKVRVPYTEQVEREYQVRVRQPLLKVRIGGKEYTLEPMPTGAKR